MSEKQIKMVTDMNDRERQRFIAALQDVIITSGMVAQALRDHDDQALMVPMMGLASSLLPLGELTNIIATAQWVDVSDLDGPIPEEEEES